MSKFMNVIGRIGRISLSSHLLYSSKTAILNSSFVPIRNCKTSGVKSEATQMTTDKETTKSTNLEQEDLSLPNEAWTKDSQDLFHKLQNEADQSDGLWVKQKSKVPPKTGNRLFTRCVYEEKGKLFEYSMFLNKREERIKSVHQFGPYTEGPRGYVHGGAIATVLDSIIGVCINNCGYASVTANLSVNFKVGIPIGSTVLAEGRVDRVEGRKVFGYAELKSPDGSLTYATSTALFININKN